MTRAWTPDSWRQHPVAQAPGWGDQAAEANATLAGLPPLVFAGEARRLRSALAAASNGGAFVVQAGDCAETFDGGSADEIRDTLKVILQMSAVLAYSLGVPVVKIARAAGQYGKPRSSPTEIVNGVELPSWKGDIVNSSAADVDARRPDPARMVDAYHQATSTLNLIRAFTQGGFASLEEVHSWNQAFVASSVTGRRYEAVAREIDQALAFMRAVGIDTESSHQISTADVWTSHEALLLDYEEALTRRDSTAAGEWYDCSAHMLWIGERTRQLDGAHLEFVRGIANPVGVKLGPAATVAETLELCEMLNPTRRSGRLCLIARMGVNEICHLAPIAEAVRMAGRQVVWLCDPMHGNTYTTPDGRKSRRFDDIVGEVEGFFAAMREAGCHPGGIHVELSGGDVTECTGGPDELGHEDLAARYTTACDPRLNARQGLELAFRIGELARR